MANWLKALFGGGHSQRPASRPLAQIVWRDGSYPTNAVGESHYQDAFEALCGGYTRSGHQIACTALLVPEPSNPYDVNAVKVTIQGRLVGYLSREGAVRFHAEMAAAGRPGEGAQCAAMIKGGWRTNQYDEGSFGVSLGVPGWGKFTLA